MRQLRIVAAWTDSQKHGQHGNDGKRTEQKLWNVELLPHDKTRADNQE